jgi:Zn-dependent protease with chaperone function
MLGIGFIGLGFMVLWFLIKFVFKSYRTDVSNMLEISEIDQPQLFTFLKKLTTESGAPFPRKVFLAPDVNASVFYNNSFWSMFLPVPKNLTIGLGLVNTLNISQFKAVMAHEFGHFSQRSMKLGSYVYQVNQVMYNMLYDNDGYRKLLQGFADISGYFVIFAKLTGYIISGIQYILQKMYGLINKEYMRLSREMEFHADGVAASVAGANHLVQALRRSEMGDAAWNTVINQYNEWISENKRGANAYSDQTEAIKYLAQFFKLPLQHDGIPDIPDAFFESSQKLRVIISNQWASHPERKEREDKLNDLGWDTPGHFEPAWKLFDNIGMVQQNLTEKLYSTVQWNDEPQLMESANFKEEQERKRDFCAYPDIYKGYYDGRILHAFDPHEVFEEYQNMQTTIGEILTEEHLSIKSRLSVIQDEISLLQAINAEGSDIRSFDFEGIKYPADEANGILQKIEEEREELLLMQKEADKKLAFLAMQRDGNVQLAKERYADFFSFNNACREMTDAVQKMFARLQPLMQGQQYMIEDAGILANYLKSTDLIDIGKAWRMLGASRLFNLQPELRDGITAMLIKDYVFFNGESFLDMEINEVMQYSDACFQAVQNNLFSAHKDLLIWQAKHLEIKAA